MHQPLQESALTAGLSPTPAVASDQATNWLPTIEAASYLGIDRKTLRRLVAQGRIPMYQLGPRMHRFKRSDLDAALVRVRTMGAQR